MKIQILITYWSFAVLFVCLKQNKMVHVPIYLNIVKHYTKFYLMMTDTANSQTTDRKIVQKVHGFLRKVQLNYVTHFTRIVKIHI